MDRRLRLLWCCLVARRAFANDAPAWIGINAITLATSDMDASRAFYAKLGLNCTYGCAAGNWSTFGGPEGALHSFHVNLFPAEDSDLAPRRGWGRVILYAADVDGVYRRAVAAGLAPEHAPRDADWGERYFQILDPSGHEIAVARPLGAEQSVPHPEDAFNAAMGVPLGVPPLRGTPA